MGSNGFWCSNCAMFHRPQVTNDAKLCCSFCGKVLCEYNCLEEVPFAKNAAIQYKEKSGVGGTNVDEKVHRENDKTGGATKHVAIDDRDSDDDSDSNESHGSNKMRGESGEEFDTFSDIDDLEIESYIHSEKEKHYKKIIWEELNREYIEEASTRIQRHRIRDPFCRVNAELLCRPCSTRVRHLFCRGQKRAKEARNSVPNRATAEAARKMLAKKTLESKINYAVLDELFNESNAKKSHFGEGGHSVERGHSGEGGTKAKRKIDGRTRVRKLNTKM